LVFVKFSGFSSGFSSGLDGFVKDSDFGFGKGSDLGCAGADECVAFCASGKPKKKIFRVPTLVLVRAQTWAPRGLMSVWPAGTNKKQTKKGGWALRGSATQSD
jgi:hypothetical protein